MKQMDAQVVAAVARFILPPSSRFRASDFYPSLRMYGRWPFNSDTFKPLPSDTYHEVRNGEEYNWPLISFRLLGSTFRWWILPLANGYIDPFDGPKVGEVIRVPDRQNVDAVLATTR